MEKFIEKFNEDPWYKEDMERVSALGRRGRERTFKHAAYVCDKYVTIVSR